MANYTYYLRDILAEAAQPGESLRNLTDLYNIAARSIFDTPAINVISEQYRQQLITGFALHYLNDEIGMETISLWEIELAETLYNNGAYINQIYDKIGKEIFSEYHVSHADSAGKHDNLVDISDKLKANGKTNTHDTGNTSTDHDGNDHNVAERTGTDKLNGITTGTGGITTTINGNKTSQSSDNRSIHNTGNDKTINTGTDTLAKTGSNTLTDNVTVTDTLTGNDTTTTTYNTTDHDEGNSTKTGQLVSNDTDNTHHYIKGGYTDHHDDTTTNRGDTTYADNGMQMTLDTPMGKLSNLHSPGGDATGLGVSYASQQDYNYLTSAAESDSTRVQTDNTDQTSQGDTIRTYQDYDANDDGVRIHTEDYNDIKDARVNDHTHTGTDTSTVSHNTTNENITKGDHITKLNETDTTTHNTQSVNNNESNTTDNNTHNSIDQTNDTHIEERNTQDQVNNTNESQSRDDINSTSHYEDRGSHENNVETTSDNTSDRTALHRDNGTNNNTTDTTDYTITYELLMRSSPLINKIWECFDDLFMMIF